MRLIDEIGIGDWARRIKIEDREFEELGMLIAKERKTKEIYPSAENVFRAFKLTQFDNVKVVILGQDPYYTPKVATGLAFESGLKNYVPPSLENIYKELNAEYGEGVPDLTSWATQGVLLLNTSLTVEREKPGIHVVYWRNFIRGVFEALSEKTSIIYVLWGNHAKRYKPLINPNFNIVLEAAHPSPLSANRGGWFGNNHFKLINEELNKIYGEEIKWL